jgi:methyl-accepting chemotaxis protein-1 (serine sensor receptor)
MFKNITIRGRLTGMLVFVALFLVAVGGGGIWGMHKSHDALEAVYQDQTMALQRLARIDRLTLIVRSLLDRSLLSPEDDQIEWNTTEAQRHLDEAGTLWAEFLKSKLTYEVNTLSQQWTYDRQSLIDNAIKPAIQALRANKVDEARAIITIEVHGLYTPVADGLNKLIEIQTKLVRDEYEKSDALNRTLRIAGIAAMTLGILVFAVVGALLLRAIVIPLDRAIGIAARVANGRLDTRIDVERHDEIGALLAELNNMSESLRGIVREVRDGASVVANTAAEITRGNLDLSHRTEEQASTLEETASSMEELAATVKRNAEHAKEANQLAGGASNIAGRGGEMMTQVVSTMSGISGASTKISEIIGVIDGIAFQTNILALNAAVEAARAGEQGRGFAVVASEVRNLAQRSAQAAKEIKALIQNSTDRVSEGTRLVEQAGETMAEIVTAVKHVSDVISEIAAANMEQLSGIEQVSRAVAQMDQVVQQNAALVEESAAAAENQSSQAETLVAAVARFHLGDEDARAQPEPAAPPQDSGNQAQVMDFRKPKALRNSSRTPRDETLESMALSAPEGELRAV